MKKVSVFLAVLIVASTLASCSRKKTAVGSESSRIQSTVSGSVQAVKAGEHVFSMPFFPSDSLNPYSAVQSTNFYLSGLLYDSLFVLDSSFNSVGVIGQSATTEGNVCTVKIKSGLKFSDGSRITLSDISASLASARSSRYYSSRLSNISSVAVRGNSLVITLKKADINFSKNLVFPIIKGGSKESRAVGSGRYCFSADDNLLLVKNKFSSRPASSIEHVSLVVANKYSLLPYMIKIGSVNFYYMDDNTIFKTSGTKTSAVLANNLVYLGVNSANADLANQDFRKAISLSINRKNISNDAYSSLAYPAAGPFNPKATGFSGGSYKITQTDVSASEKLFETAGYIKKGTLTYVDQSQVRLRLAVNSDNSQRLRAANLVKLNLEAQGIGIDLIEESNANYRARIASGNYDLFIGEIKLSPDNNIGSLLSFSAFNRCNDEGETYAMYQKYLSGEAEIDDFMRLFDLKTPFIPLVYRNAMSVFSGSINGNKTVTEYDLFYSMDSWTFGSAGDKK